MRPWTQEDKEAARELRSNGWTLQQLARLFQVSKVSVWRVCRGVVCPVDHRRRAAADNLRKAWADPVKRERMKFLISEARKKWRKGSD